MTCSRCNSEKHDTAGCPHKPSVTAIVAELRRLQRENQRLRENYNELACRINRLRERKDVFADMPNPLPYEEK